MAREKVVAFPLRLRTDLYKRIRAERESLNRQGVTASMNSIINEWLEEYEDMGK